MQFLADVLVLSRPQAASAAVSVESASGNSGARNQDGPAVVPVGAAAPVDSANDLGGPAAVLVRAASPRGGGRGRQKLWNQARAAGQQRRRWKQSVKTVRAKAKAKATQASASLVAARHLLAGVVDFTGTEGERARGRWKWNFATVMRAAFAPPALALRQVSEACFGSQVSYSNVQRLKLRVAKSICDLTNSRVAQVLNHVAVGASVNPLCGSTGPALSGGGGAKILVVGQVWKWDSTEVRWRTVDQGGTPACSTSNLAQRGWLLFRRADGATLRFPLPVANVAMSSKTARDLWVNLAAPLTTRSPVLAAVARSHLVVLMFVGDGASENLKLAAHEVACSPANVLVVYVRCLAHQLHICSKCQFCSVGVRFVKSTSSAARVFRVAKYHQKLVQAILDEVAKCAHVVLPGDRTAQCLDSSRVQAQCRLLKYLLLCVHGHLTQSLEAAADKVAALLNHDWTAPDIVHFSDGTLTSAKQLAEAVAGPLRLILGRQPSLASESRWTDVAPACVGQCLLLVIHRLGARALAAAWPPARPRGKRGRGRAAQAVDPGDTSSSGGEASFAVVQGRRLEHTRRQWSDPRTLGTLLVALVANDPVRHVLHWVFQHEASTYPDLRGYSARYSHAPSGTSPFGRSAVCALSCGSVQSQLSRGCMLLRPGALALSAHSVALQFACASFRGSSEQPGELLRQVLLPGLAQLWFRVDRQFTAVWPFRLLQLLDPQRSHPVQLQLATEWVGSFTRCPHCLDHGFSRPALLYLLGKHVGPDSGGDLWPVSPEQCSYLAQVVADLRDPEFRAALEHLAEDLEVSIVDVECRHARNRRCQRGGRPPNFSSMAAQCLIREASVLHAQVTGALPHHHLAHRVASAQAALALPPARCLWLLLERVGEAEVCMSHVTSH